MRRYEYTGLARFPAYLVEFGEELGMDREKLMSAAGLSEEDIAEPDGRVPVQVTWDLWEQLARFAPDQPLGMMLGRDTRAQDLGLVGYTMAHSRCLRRALDRLSRYSHILLQAIRFDLVEEGDTGHVDLDNEPEAAALRHPVDSRLAAVLGVAREITATDIVPVEVRFCYPEPADTTAHREFFRCPLLFGTGKSMVVLRTVDLDRLVVTADETLSGYLDSLADELLQAGIPRGSFVERVQRAIWTKLSGGQPTLSHLAEVLGVSVRTLQRRLRQEGTSFAKLLEGVRRHMSVRLLHNDDLAVYEVAYLLGYSEPSTFFRAFRRWHGLAPNAYRKQKNNGAAGSEEPTAPGGEVV